MHSGGGQDIIGELTSDKTLNDKYVPMLNPTPQVDGPAKIVQSWYEKGELWGPPSDDLARVREQWQLPRSVSTSAFVPFICPRGLNFRRAYGRELTAFPRPSPFYFQTVRRE